MDDQLKQENNKLAVPQAPLLSQNFPLWKCELAKFQAELSELKVGDAFGLICQGDPIDIPSGISMAQLEWLNKDNEYKLNVLEVKSLTNSRADFIVNSYKPGAHKELSFGVIADKTSSGFKVEGLTFEVKSVVKQGEQVQAAGPLLAPPLLMPQWYYIIWGFIAVFLIALIVGYLRRVVKKKKFYELNDLEPSTAMLRSWGAKYSKSSARKDKLAYMEFNKQIRGMYKKFPVERKAEFTPDLVEPFVGDLKAAISQFLTLYFWIPARDWSITKISQSIKIQNRKLSNRHGAELRNLLVEIKKSEKAANRLDAEDCEQLLVMSKKIVGTLYNFEQRGLK